MAPGSAAHVGEGTVAEAGGGFGGLVLIVGHVPCNVVAILSGVVVGRHLLGMVGIGCHFLIPCDRRCWLAFFRSLKLVGLRFLQDLDFEI